MFSFFVSRQVRHAAERQATYIAPTTHNTMRLTMSDHGAPLSERRSARITNEHNKNAGISVF